MVKIKDEYKISEAAEFLGISADTIRYYDNQKILCPRKDEVTNYRYYTWSDLLSMEEILRLKRINLPLQQIGHIVNEYTMEQVVDAFQKHEQELEKQLEELTKARRMVRYYIQTYEAFLRNEGQIGVEMSPVFICGRVDREVNRVIEDFQRLTYRQIPIFTVFTSVKEIEGVDELPYPEYIDKIRNREESYITIADDEGLVESGLVAENSEIEIIPSQLCIHMLKKVAYKEERFSVLEVLSYARKHGFEAAGKMMVQFLGHSKRQGNEEDYYGLYLPVRKKQG